MDPVDVPDLSKWVENLANRIAVEDKGNPIGSAKFFFRFDLKNPDKRVHKLMQQCMIFYAFNVEIAVKEWIVYEDMGSGGFRKVLYSAILMDRINDKWAIGLPDEGWIPEVIYSDGKISGISFKLKTADGLKSVYVKNPNQIK